LQYQFWEFSVSLADHTSVRPPAITSLGPIAVSDVVVLVLCGALAGAALFLVAPRILMGDDRIVHTMHGKLKMFWGWSDKSLWRFIAAFPLIALSSTAFVVAFGIIVATGSQDAGVLRNPEALSGWAWTVLVAVAVGLVSVLAAASIVLFGRPRWLMASRVGRVAK